MITISEAIAKMIVESKGSQRDINHFLKVWSYAKTIGEMEGLDARSQKILEYTAVVHDIACPDLRKEYGNAPGHLQEKYGPALVREFYKDGTMESQMLERICYLVGHHHTYTGVDGLDYQILLEADFLVNAGESEKYHAQVSHFLENVFKTETGSRLLEEIYIKHAEDK